MSPPRVLVVLALALAMLLAAPSHAVPEVAQVGQVGQSAASSTQPSMDDALERHVNHREQALSALLTAAEQHASVEGVRTSRLAALGYSGDVDNLDHVLPLPAFSYSLSAGFGAAGALWESTHTGLDFSAPLGTQIVAVADGTVTEVAYAGAYGIRTILTLEDGTDIWYAHQLRPLVYQGQTIEIGQPIGLVGSTGNSTGPHLHLEVRPGGEGPVDPMGWLLDRVPVT